MSQQKQRWRRNAARYREKHRDEINRRQIAWRKTHRPTPEQVQRTREYHRERNFRWHGRDVAQSDEVSTMLYGRWFQLAIVNRRELQNPLLNVNGKKVRLFDE